ncbi:MAG: hypothetical protein ACLQUY_14185 [Ktedonobacterales bacterium]
MAKISLWFLTDAELVRQDEGALDPRTLPPRTLPPRSRYRMCLLRTHRLGGAYFAVVLPPDQAIHPKVLWNHQTEVEFTQGSIYGS